MQKAARIKNILNLIKETGWVQTSQISRIYQVSKETLRKDLTELEELGLIRRSYGKIEILNYEKFNTYIKDNGFLSKEERQKAIEKIVREKKKLRLASLAAEFQVTTATIRSDIKELRDKSNILKNHGTVIFDSESPVRKNFDNPEIMLEPDQIMIASRALSLIKPGETIYLDDGFASHYIASHISTENRSVIITNSLTVIQILMFRKYGYETILLPGSVDYNSNTISLKYTETILNQILIEKAIVTLNAYHEDHGFFVSAISEQENLQTVFTHARNIIICIQSRDLDKTGVLNLSDRDFKDSINEIITDDFSDEIKLASLQKSKLPVVYCGNNYIKNSRNASTHKIGFLYSSLNSYYGKTVRESIENAVNEHRNLSLLSMPVNEEYKSLMLQLDKLIEEKIDILIVYITNYEIGHLISERSSHLHIRLLSIDISLPNSIFFGANNYHAGIIGGKECGRFVKKYWNGSYDSIINIENQSTGDASGFRLSSMIQEMGETIVVDEEKIYHLDLSLLLKQSDEAITNRLFTIIGKRNIFLSFSEKTTLHLSSILPLLPETTFNIVIGHNFNERIKTLMGVPDSPILGCVSYHPESYGEKVVTLVENLIDNKQVQQMNYTQHEWIGNESFNPKGKEK